MLAREFQKKGNEVKVITKEKSDRTDCGVQTFYQPSFFKTISLYYWCDVFYMPNVSLKGWWLKLFQPFKRWIISHNGWYERKENVVGWQDKIKLLLTRFVSANISVSKVVADRLPVKSTIIHNCYESGIFFPLNIPRTKEVLFVGRLVSDKGCELLVDACISLWKKGMKFNLTITGDGPEKKVLEEKISNASVQNFVTFTGFKKEQALNEVFNQHKILVVPSRWKEPFGIVALEGLAAGCRVLCSDEGGLPEATGSFGYTFKRNSVSDLEKKLQELLTNDNYQAGNGLVNFLNERTPSKIAGKYLEVFTGSSKE